MKKLEVWIKSGKVTEPGGLTIIDAQKFDQIDDLMAEIRAVILDTLGKGLSDE